MRRILRLISIHHVSSGFALSCVALSCLQRPLRTRPPHVSRMSKVFSSLRARRTGGRAQELMSKQILIVFLVQRGRHRGISRVDDLSHLLHQDTVTEGEEMLSQRRGTSSNGVASI